MLIPITLIGASSLAVYYLIKKFRFEADKTVWAKQQRIKYPDMPEEELRNISYLRPLDDKGPYDVDLLWGTTPA